jgi:hypothetical protein
VSSEKAMKAVEVWRSPRGCVSPLNMVTDMPPLRGTSITVPVGDEVHVDVLGTALTHHAQERLPHVTCDEGESLARSSPSMSKKAWKLLAVRSLATCITPLASGVPWTPVDTNGNTWWGDYQGMASSIQSNVTFISTWADNRSGGSNARIYATSFNP